MTIIERSTTRTTPEPPPSPATAGLAGSPVPAGSSCFCSAWTSWSSCPAT